MKRGDVRKFFFPKIPKSDFEKGYFGGDHDALVWSEMNEKGMCWVIPISSKNNYSQSYKWIKRSDGRFQGYLLFDKIASIPCRKWACDVCGLTGQFVGKSLDAMSVALLANLSVSLWMM